MDSQQDQTFRPLTRQAKPRRVAAFDTEGNGSPGGFVCGSVVSDQEEVTFSDQWEMLEYLCSPRFRGYWLFAHNLEYDLGVITSGDLRYFSILFVRSKILYAETKDSTGHRFRFCDSTNLFPGQTVAALGEMVGNPKRDLPPEVDAALRSPNPNDHITPEDDWVITAYCLNDARIVYQAIMALQDELLSLGGKLQTTLAGVSMDLFRRRYLVEPWRTPHQGLNQLARGAYYGARTEPYRLGLVKGVNGYDVSSLYPSVQRDTLYPHPDHLTLHLNTSARRSIDRREGICACAIEAPSMEVPLLPLRVNGHLYFPSGILRAVWTHSELRRALDIGYKLRSVDWSLFSTQSFNPFTQFIDDLYRRRLLHASSGDLRENVFKLLLNSAYGRYGLDPSEGLYALEPIPPDPDWSKFAGADLRMINGWPYALVPIGTDTQPAYCNVLIAAYTTAAARLKMHDEIIPVSDRLCYTDTDSLWTYGEVTTAEGLGGMRQTHQGVDLWVVAPKEYAVFHNEALIEAHAKGIPEAHRLLYMRTGRAVFDSPMRIREAAATQSAPAVWVKRLKQRRYQVPKRAPILQPGQGVDHVQTRPWSSLELLDFLEQPLPLSDPLATCPAPPGSVTRPLAAFGRE